MPFTLAASFFNGLLQAAGFAGMSVALGTGLWLALAIMPRFRSRRWGVAVLVGASVMLGVVMASITSPPTIAPPPRALQGPALPAIGVAPPLTRGVGATRRARDLAPAARPAAAVAEAQEELSLSTPAGERPSVDVSMPPSAPFRSEAPSPSFNYTYSPSPSAPTAPGSSGPAGSKPESASDVPEPRDVEEPFDPSQADRPPTPSGFVSNGPPDPVPRPGKGLSRTAARLGARAFGSGGFSIRFPIGWPVQGPPSNIEAGNGAGATLSVRFVPARRPAPLVAALFGAIQKHLEEQTDTVIHASGTDTLDSHPYVWFKYTGADPTLAGGTLRTTVVYVFPLEGGTVEVRASAAADQFPSIEPLLKPSIESFALGRFEGGSIPPIPAGPR